MELEEKPENHRPWGYYEVLSEKSGHKVKRIIVHPGGRTSLQLHNHRNEHWHIVSGEALARKANLEVRLTPGESIDIELGVLHRLGNPGHDDLVLIEIQRGDYLGEDDIVRFEDDYGRVNPA